MDRSGDEGMSKTVHGEERSCGGCVTEIIDKGSLRHGRAGSRLCRYDSDIGAVYFIQDKGEGKTSKVASSAYTPCHDIDFLLPKFFQLFLGFKADDRLMHHHMVQDASQGVSSVLGGDSVFNGFADGDPKASRGVWALLQNLSSGIGVFARAGNTVCSPGVHHHTAIGFLVVTDPHHIDLALQTEEAASKTECTSPLSSTHLGSDSFVAEAC